MSYNLVLNSSNVIGSNNSTFKYTFINGSFEINEESQMCVSQIVIPYSWFNINNNYYKNATLQYYFPNQLRPGIYTVIFPDGFYSVSDLNNYLQNYMISQNQYFINSVTGENLYFIQIVTNVTYYSNQIVTTPIPLSLPTGYTYPTVSLVNGYSYTGFNCNYVSVGYWINSSANFFPSSSVTPQVIIPSYTLIYGIGSILGFLSGYYPPTVQSSSYNVLSNTTPNATPVNSLVIRSDLVNNQCASPSDILDCISISNTSFGSNIVYTPYYEKWISIQPGIFNSFIISIEDQNFNNIQSNDPNVLISLLLRQGKNIIKKEITQKNITPLIKQLEFKYEKGESEE